MEIQWGLSSKPYLATYAIGSVLTMLKSVYYSLKVIEPFLIESTLKGVGMAKFEILPFFAYPVIVAGV